MNITNGSFSLTLTDSYDPAFIEKVAGRFRDSGAGWSASIVKKFNMGQYIVFVLSHDSFKSLPSARSSNFGWRPD